MSTWFLQKQHLYLINSYILSIFTISLSFNRSGRHSAVNLFLEQYEYDQGR